MDKAVVVTYFHEKCTYIKTCSIDYIIINELPPWTVWKYEFYGQTLKMAKSAFLLIDINIPIPLR